MSNHRKAEQPWFQDAVEAIVREGQTLQQYCSHRELGISLQEVGRIHSSKRFQDMLWAERQKFQTEVANTPGRNKTSLLGLAVILIQKLIDEGQWDKAITGIEKLAKIEGWAGGENNVNIFAGITAQDIEKMKLDLTKGKVEPKTVLDLLN